MKEDNKEDNKEVNKESNEYNFPKLLKPSIPNLKSYDSVVISDTCLFCESVIDKIYEIPIDEYELMAQSCNVCYNIMNVGLNSSMFIIGISELNQQEIVKKTIELMEKNNTDIPVHISLIDKNAIVVPLSAIEYSFVLEYILRNKIENSIFSKMKLFLKNIKEFSNYSFFGNLVSNNIDKGIIIHEFTEHEKTFLNSCFYSIPNKSYSRLIETSELIEDNNKNIKIIEEILYSEKFLEIIKR